MYSIYPKLKFFITLLRCANIPTIRKLVNGIVRQYCLWFTALTVLAYVGKDFLYMSMATSMLLFLAITIVVQQIVLLSTGHNVNPVSKIQSDTIFSLNWYLANIQIKMRPGIAMMGRSLSNKKAHWFSRLVNRFWWKYSSDSVAEMVLPQPKRGTFRYANNYATAMFKVRVPQTETRESYARIIGQMGTAMPNHPTHGNISEIIIDPDAEDKMQSMKVILSYRSLPPSMKSDKLIEPLSASKFIIGQNYLGDEIWDTSLHPHLVLFGTSGGGKSNLLRILAGEAKQSEFWKTLVIDAQGSGQWAPFDDDDENFELFEMPEDEVSGTEYLYDCLVHIFEQIRERANLLKKHQVDNFKDLPVDVQREHKRWLVLLDEGNAVVGKTPDPALAAARKNVCKWFEHNAKQIRKWGGHLVYSDQVTHPKNTYLDAGVFEQFMRYIFVNNVDDDTKGIIGAIKVPILPSREDAPSAAISGVRNEEGAKEIRIELVEQPVYWEGFGAEIRDDNQTKTDIKVQSFLDEREKLLEKAS